MNNNIQFNNKYIAWSVISVVISIALFNSITPNLLFHDDYVLFSESITNTPRESSKFLWYPLVRYFMLIDESISRIFILIFFILTSILAFHLSKRVAFKSTLIAIAFSIAISINPNQTILPIFMMGSYFVYGVFFFVLSVFCIYKSIQVKKHNTIFLICSILFFYLTLDAIHITSIFLLYAYTLLQIFLSGKFKFKTPQFLVALLSSLLITIFWTSTVLNTQAASKSINKLGFHTRVERINKILEWSNIFDLDGKASLITFALILIGLLILSFKSIQTYFKKNENNGRYLNLFQVTRENNFSLILFGALWCVCFFLPFLFSKYYSVRYAYPFSLGYIFLSFLLIDRIIANKPKVTLVATILIIALVSYLRINKIHKRYSKHEKTTEILSSELNSYSFPENSQIILTGKTHDVATGGFWVWSSGFLKYVTKRADITGIVEGPKLYFHDFLDKTKRGYNYKMSGIDTIHPVFIFRLNGNGKLHKKDYILNCKNSADNLDNLSWELIKLDTLSGIIEHKHIGDTYLNLITTVNRLKINENKIYGYKQIQNDDSAQKIVKIERADKSNYELLLLGGDSLFENGKKYSEELLINNLNDGYIINLIDSVNLIKNGAFDNDLSRWHCWSSDKNCVAKIVTESKIAEITNLSTDLKNEVLLTSKKLYLPDSLVITNKVLIAFDLMCPNDCTLDVYVRQRKSPYRIAKKFRINTNSDSMQTFVRSFNFETSLSDYRLDFGINPDDTPVLLDNIGVHYLKEFGSQ